MKKTILKALLATTMLLSAAPSFASDDINNIVDGGEFFGNLRYRYENVDQKNRASEANASTMRLNFGFKTGEYKNFKALIEGQTIRRLGDDDYNDTINGKATYPVVADPQTTEVNQAWLGYTGIPDTYIQAGRQGINIDNQRFIGTVGWRQNDQTFDSVTVTNTSIDGLKLTYGYVWNVNRIFGDSHVAGDLSTDTHIANANYKFHDLANVTAYGLWLDIHRLAALSTKTYGLRITGKAPINDTWSFSYEAEYARQSEHGNNTANFNENYYHFAPAISGMGLTLKAGYEELGGNGTTAFQTPLATLHKFNGWSDQFLSTNANGLEDVYASIAYKFGADVPYINNAQITAVYHDFSGDQTGDYGSELDLSIGKAFNLPKELPADKVHFLLKYADYNAEDAPYADTEKLWLQMNIQY